MTVQLREPDAVVALPRSCASHINAGFLELSIDARTLRDRYLDVETAGRWAQYPDRPADDAYVPAEVAEALWDALPERGWSALERLALAEDVRDESRLEAGHLNDVVLVARNMQAGDAPFPATLAEFTEVLNRVAASLPHETSGS